MENETASGVVWRWAEWLGQPELPYRRWLFFIKGDEIFHFQVKNIPGVVTIKDISFINRPGNLWISIQFWPGDGVRCIKGRDGENGSSFMEGLADAVGIDVDAVGIDVPSTWTEVAAAFGVSVPSVMKFLRAWDSGVATLLDAAERDPEKDSNAPRL